MDSVQTNTISPSSSGSHNPIKAAEIITKIKSRNHKKGTILMGFPLTAEDEDILTNPELGDTKISHLKKKKSQSPRQTQELTDSSETNNSGDMKRGRGRPRLTEQDRINRPHSNSKPKAKKRARSESENSSSDAEAPATAKVKRTGPKSSKASMKR